MSSINSITNNQVYTPPVTSTPPKPPVLAPASTPQTQAPANAASYRNSFGDSVNISNVVVKDRDGDGDQGKPEKAGS